jgi:hypothetical protein
MWQERTNTQTISEMTKTGRRLGAALPDAQAGLYLAHIFFCRTFVGVITAINVHIEQ